MYGVGVVEIVAGVLVAIWPQYFAYVITLWLWGIIINLLTTGSYYDIALRDFGLSMGALTLARLARVNQVERHGQLELQPVAAEASAEVTRGRAQRAA
jgi:hypothetical protein